MRWDGADLALGISLASTLADVAAICRVEPRTVQRWCCGEQRPAEGSASDRTASAFAAIGGQHRSRSILAMDDAQASVRRWARCAANIGHAGAVVSGVHWVCCLCGWRMGEVRR